MCDFKNDFTLQADRDGENINPSNHLC